LSELIYKERIGKDELVIRPFEEKDAPGLAKLLNESEEGWPGGFTGGIPFTADRVLEEAKREKPLVYYVLTLNDQILGVCTLSEHWLEKSVAYVSFLNTHLGRQHEGCPALQENRLLLDARNKGVPAESCPSDSQLPTRKGVLP